jgi:hypothetical protein
VGSPVFKTGERRSASLAGSIPVRLRYLHECRRAGEWLATSKIKPGCAGTLMAREVITPPPGWPCGHEGLDRRRGCLTQLIEHGHVDVGREGRRGVAHGGADHLQIHARCEQHRGAAVPEVMEPEG